MGFQRQKKTLFNLPKKQLKNEFLLLLYRIVCFFHIRAQKTALRYNSPKSGFSLRFNSASVKISAQGKNLREPHTVQNILHRSRHIVKLHHPTL